MTRIDPRFDKKVIFSVKIFYESSVERKLDLNVQSRETIKTWKADNPNFLHISTCFPYYRIPFSILIYK